MYSSTIAALFLFLMPANGDSKAELAKADAKKLQGAWVMVGLEIDGTVISETKIKGTTLEIKGDKYIVKTGGKAREVRFALDASKKPKEIDLFFPDPPNADKLHRGIYLIDGDTFKMCKAQAADQRRPTEFGTWPNTGIFMVTWSRRVPD